MHKIDAVVFVNFVTSYNKCIIVVLFLCCYRLSRNLRSKLLCVKLGFFFAF